MKENLTTDSPVHTTQTNSWLKFGGRQWNRLAGLLAMAAACLACESARAATLDFLDQTYTTGGSACTGPFTLNLYGTGFSSSSGANVVYWGNANWGAATYNPPVGSGTNISAAYLTVTVSCADRPLGSTEEFKSDLITVKVNGAGTGGIPFTLVGPNVDSANANTILASQGGYNFVQSMNAAAGSGVSGEMNVVGSISVPVTVLTYNSVPPSTGGLVFDAGGGYYDIQVITPVNTGDSLTAVLYYPNTGSLQDPNDSNLRLKYYDGTTYTDVLIGGLPVSPTSTLNGSSPNFPYGGYFEVTFDGNSAPSIDDLGGTIFTMAPTPLSASSSTLWPPNHKMVPVTVDAPGGGWIVSVSSSEPESGLGNGDLAPDWEITGPLTVNLRAERRNAGRGRIYSILLQLNDGSQNLAVVRVPHGMGKQ